MIIYNVTLSINPTVETEFIDWLKNVHIPEVLDTQLFVSGELFKVFERPSSNQHSSYAVQYRLESWGHFNQYQLEFAAGLQQKTREKFGENVLAFRTFLERQ